LSTAVTITPRTVIDPRTGQVHGSVTSDATGPIAAGNLDPRDVKEVFRVFLLRGYWGKGGAIKIAADNPDMQPGEIAQNVQGSATPTAYTQWENEAKAILDAWGGVGQVSTLRESFQFRIGGKLKKGDLNDENYWAGTGRLANDVDGWRRYAWRNVLWFVSDEWKFQRKPAFVIGPEHVYASQNDGTQPPVDIQIGQVDVGLTLSELTITARMRRWDGAPADVVELVDLGPISGKWLIWTNRFDLQRDVGELTLHRPAPKGPEPAPDTTSVLRTESRPDSGTPRQLIVAAAEKAFKLGPSVYFYRQSRPMPASLFPAANVSGPGIVQLDCSAFATLVYKTAGVPDPNGLGYNGSGYTGTLIANGKRTSDPQPGDLVFYGPGQGAGGSPGHVGVYVGAGKVIEMGGNPGPLKLSVDYRSDKIGYYSYDLGLTSTLAYALPSGHERKSPGEDAPGAPRASRTARGGAGRQPQPASRRASRGRLELQALDPIERAGGVGAPRPMAGPDQVSILFRFGVTSDVHFALAGAGLVRVGDVEDAIDDELLRICGIGPKRVAMIRRAIRRYREQASTSAGAP
jgi:hypothetical protein